MRLLITANTDWYVHNFRSSLISAVLARGDEVVVACPDGAFRAALQDLGVRWYRCEFRRRSFNVLHDFESAMRLRSIVRATAPDLMHNFTLKSILAGTIAATFRPSMPVINSFEGLGYVFTGRERRARLLRPLLTAALMLINRRSNSYAIVLNPADLDRFSASGIAPAARLRIVPGAGVDTTRYVARGDAPERFTILYASRLIKPKGIGTLVEAVQQLTRVGHDLVLRIAGSVDAGNPDSVDEAELASWAALPKVEVLGYREDVAGLIARSSVVVLVSTYGEGIPTILVEAGALGVPVITSAQAGCREVVGNEEGGLIVEPDDAAALAAALLKLKQDPALAAQLGARGRTRVVARFEQSAINQAIFDVYDEALSSSLRRV